MPVRNRDSNLVVAAIQQAGQLVPFSLLNVIFDNDGAFMNELAVCWCRSHGLEDTRSRACRKCDQAWGEQKNGAVVLRLVGYATSVGAEATATLGSLYEAVTLHDNLFQTSFKLGKKTRISARVIERHHQPVPPVERVLSHSDVAADDKGRLVRLMATADPVMLFAGICTRRKSW